MQKPLLSLALRPQCALEDGRLNSRSSLGNRAAEPLLGLEVTLETGGKKVDVTVGLSRWHGFALGSSLLSAFPPPPHLLCSDLGSQPGWPWGWRPCQERGKERRPGRGMCRALGEEPTERSAWGQGKNKGAELWGSNASLSGPGAPVAGLWCTVEQVVPPTPGGAIHIDHREWQPAGIGTPQG